MILKSSKVHSASRGLIFVVARQNLQRRGRATFLPPRDARKRTLGTTPRSGSCTADDGAASSVDTLIVGGGPVGASTAFHLARRRMLSTPAEGGLDPSVMVVERDPSYQSGSAVFSAGGIRLQFSLEENVAMSLYGIDFMKNSASLLSLEDTNGSHGNVPREPVDIQYVENGYLLLASTDDAAQQFQRNHSLYGQLGCSDMIELMGPKELKAKFPWMNVDDVVLGSYGRRGEGWFDPWSYIQGLNQKNMELGVRYRRGTVVGAERDPVSGLIHSVDILDRASDAVCNVRVGTVVNAAGAAADAVMNLLAGEERPLAHPIPVRPRKRCIYFFRCDSNQEEAVPDLAPLTIDRSGAYFRSEGAGGGTGRFLCGMSPPSEEDRDCYDPYELKNADPTLFERDIWPALYHRVPAFGCIKVQSSWAGLYEYNVVDQNCILDFHPEMGNVLMANGFSGHGLQHSPAAGRAAAELIDNGGRYETLNLDAFRFDRLMEGGDPLYEKGIY
jgi:FAD-dependent oxidoreductase domain-containing protein 1